MPPRYAYWTILVDEQPTAFRGASQEDLMPTFKRLKEKNASAKMMWWQNGKLWNSRVDAQEAMRARGEMGRRGDVRQRQDDQRPARLEWRPKEQKFAGAGGESRRSPRRAGALEWKPKGEASSQHSRREGGRPPGGDRRPRSAAGKLEWKPKGEAATSPKRKWIPKEEYEKSRGVEAKRDKNWRPGGTHKDPRQKYKDAKKAKWGRFKQNIRQKWEAKQGRKKRDEE